MAAVQKKQKAAHEPPANSIVNIPSQVSIEVLGNGTGLLRACFILRTPLKTYMFNCPENACRFLWQLRIRSSSVVDLFITSANWDNIAGISSILLSKESNALSTRLHGAMNIKHFLECIRPFQDSDYGSCKYPSQVEERPYTMENYEDAGLKVTYIPLSPPLNIGSNNEKSKNVKVNNVDIAFLIEMKEAARRIDTMKLMELKVPKGPLIGKLKSGEAVTLPDGRTIQPDQVFSSDKVEGDKPLLLVTECTTEDHVKALIDSSSLQPFLNGEKQLDYMVHISDDAVINTPTYRHLMEKLNNPSITHLLINGGNPVIPAVESVYKHTRLLRSIAPSLFPALHPIDWSGIITQNEELSQRQDQFIRVAPMQRYWMRRGASFNEEPIVNNLLAAEPELSDKAKELIKEYQKLEKENKMDCEFPKLTFFGTSSAVPSKYRNVTGYLVEASENSAILIDVGEGTYGQMRAVFGEDGCKQLLVNLNCVLITHAHQDHMNGLYTIIARRKEAFESLGAPYRPLVLVCNRNVLKPMKTYSICFENIEHLLEIVDISRYPLTPPGSPGGPPGKRPRLPSPHLPPSRDVLQDMSSSFDKKAWKLDELKAVQVHHTRMANGFVMRVAGKRIVFSGDTKPCDLLVEEGKDADVLVHESTFEDGHEADAMRKRHSTMGQAVDVGKRMNAKHIILTHFSARYPKVPVLPEYLDKENIGVAMDMLRVRFDHLPLVSKLLPIFREVFVAELFELTIKKEQRVLKDKELSEKRGQLKA
ncbi:Zinc phosphodiesterase ELAC protein 2 homolog [Caenorhabditis elegans]|nr:Zinc phosphodiesterase ELAC protein 2 homolog [Caenorhabditis elegans]CCD68706.1 Zinc phosphodiesterase ELAC protein 2 homolog [Caenorhabditis elegans]|eukprot:NP_001023110.1 Ribonuclease Z [Caenorhabditis elegans]